MTSERMYLQIENRLHEIQNVRGNQLVLLGWIEAVQRLPTSVEGDLGPDVKGTKVGWKPQTVFEFDIAFEESSHSILNSTPAVVHSELVVSCPVPSHCICIYSVATKKEERGYVQSNTSPTKRTIISHKNLNAINSSIIKPRSHHQPPPFQSYSCYDPDP